MPFKVYLRQLIILSRLRYAEDIAIKIAQEMPIQIDLENDHLYKMGVAKAGRLFKVKEQEYQKTLAQIKAEKLREQKIAAKMLADADKRERQLKAKQKKEKDLLIKKLILTNTMTIAEIAKLMEVSVQKVVGVRRKYIK